MTGLGSSSSDEERSGERQTEIGRRELLKKGLAIGAAVWVTPAVQALSVSPAYAQTTSPPPPPPDGETRLNVVKTGPPGVFAEQEFDFTIVITNAEAETAQNVVAVDTLPTEGEFVSSTPPATPSGGQITFNIGALGPGDSALITIRWRAPQNETTLVNSVTVTADNAPTASDSASVDVGVTTTGLGDVAAAGTGLRNRSTGTITISGIPSGAVITRAVLTWAILHAGTPPPGTLTFNGSPVTANVSAVPSGTLCWGDSGTIGYASDVTSLVSGNGTYTISDAIQGEFRQDSDPSGTLPFTDGASLFVFYTGGPADGQVISNFSYSTNTDPSSMQNRRQFNSFVATGAGAKVILAGPDGQNNANEVVVFTDTGSMSFDNTFDGSDPIASPNLSIGNLWDTDLYDVGSIIQAGDSQLVVTADGGDCIGVSGAVAVIR